jgi:hypothetical protein
MPPSFNDSIGPILLGTIFSTFLLGINTLQAFNYFVYFPEESYSTNWWMVTILLFLDFVHSAENIATVYYWCVTNFANPEVLALATWPTCFAPMVVGLVTLIAQAFYAYRVWIIGERRRLIPFAILGLALIQCIFAIWTTGHAISFGRQFALFSTMTWHVSIWLFSAAAADILVTSAMVFYLRQSKSSFERTNVILQTLIRNVIETNALSCLVAIVDGIVFIVVEAPWHMLLNTCLPKLYINSVLVSLNARVKLRAPGYSNSQKTSPAGLTNKNTGNLTNFESMELGATTAGNRSRPGQVVHVSIVETVDVDSRMRDEK